MKAVTSLVFCLAMGWNETWDDILGGGNPRWKVDDVEKKAIALDHMERNAATNSPLEIFCPLAGDDPFVHYAWTRGHCVTGADLVPSAVEAMRKQFKEGHWNKDVHPTEESVTIWKHNSGRATLYETDILVPFGELNGRFDAIYDKDSFGALEKSMRSAYCKRIADYTKDGGIIYTEVKLKPDNHPGRFAGPPFSVNKEDLMETGNFGHSFDYVESLGEVYDVPIPNMSQTGHILKRMVR